jgi:hypothetical protein
MFMPAMELELELAAGVAGVADIDMPGLMVAELSAAALAHPVASRAARAATAIGAVRRSGRRNRLSVGM